MRVLGLDLGTTSVGHALIAFDPEQDSGQVIAAGVRIFPETRDPQSKQPKNQDRRAKRMLRRQLRRRRQRRRDVAAALADAGLLPQYGDAAWAALCRLDPYALRRRALDEALPPHHVGRLLHHLGKRRHFKGREAAEADAAETAKPARKQRQDDAADQDEKAAQDQRESFRAAVHASGLTVGAYLAGLPPTERRRGHHAHRDDIAAEVDRIWQAQARHDPARYTDAARAAIEAALFFQRPVFWRINSLGHCRLIDRARPCPKGAWISHQRRMFEALNNLGLAGGNERPLDAAERAAILAALQPVRRLSWGACRKIIGRIGVARGEAKGWEKRVAFNREATGDKFLPGNPLEAELARVVGAAWDQFPQRDALRRALFDHLMQADFGTVGDGQRIVILSAEQRRANRAALAGTLADRFGLTGDQAADLAGLPVQSGWDAYSAEAIERLLPELDQGTRLGALLNGPEWEDWRNTIFPTRVAPTGEILDRLPTPRDKTEATRLLGLRNPTVVRVQNEMRKVVNNLIAVHGRPDLIRVEVTRAVGQSARERDDADSRNRRHRRERATATAILKRQGIASPRRRDIDKYLLWQETGERCPYSGDHVGFNDLFGPAPGYDIEHIRPRAQSLDDSFGNLTICRKDFNTRKGNRLPHEAFHADEPLWATMVERVRAMANGRAGGKMPQSKLRRFLETALEDGFAERQLNDTGWAARAAVASLKRLWPDLGPTAPVTVQAVSGRVTAHLRYLWGLNSVLSDGERKSRDDHRHHAIDALVVACAHPGTTNQLSRYWQLKDDPAAVKPALPPPWPSIRDDAVTMVAGITVSHRVQRKVSGPLHEETALGDTGEDVTKQRVSYRLYVTRKPVAALTPAVLKADDEGIRDPVVKAILRDRLAEHGGDLKKAFADPVTFPTGRPIRRVRVTTKRQPALMAETRAGHAKTGSNHHMAIFKTGGGAVVFRVVSRLEAARRLSRRRPVVDRHAVPDGRFLFSLCPGEAVHLPAGDRAGIWIVRSVWSNGQFTLERHTDSVAATTWEPNLASLNKAGARKIAIDPIGRIRPARD